MTTRSENKSKIEIICEEAAFVAGEKVVYRLYELSLGTLQRYALFVSMNGESEMCIIGKTKDEADEFFKLVLVNGLTPCTLEDIARDIGKNYM